MNDQINGLTLVLAECRKRLIRMGKSKRAVSFEARVADEITNLMCAVSDVKEDVKEWRNATWIMTGCFVIMFFLWAAEGDKLGLWPYIQGWFQ